MTYVESYETTRRFEDYSRKNRNLDANVLTNDAYYDNVFDTTALDVHGAMTAEILEDARFADMQFFRVYSSTMSPPYPVFIVGVKTNGCVFRFQGFPESDFDRMVRGTGAGSHDSLNPIVRLYYRLHTLFDPGPILDERAMRRAARVIAKTGEGSEELLLPSREVVQASTIVTLCVFDSDSIRLEVHRIRVDPDGQLEILEQRIVRDKKKLTY